METKPELLSELLINCSIDAIIAFDNSGAVIAWNTAAEELYGNTAKEAIGKKLTEIIPGLDEDDETIHAIDLALKGFKSFVPANLSFPHRSHSENHYIPLRKDAEKIGGVMNIVHDVSHRIKAERRLEDLNRRLKTQYQQLQNTSNELASFTFVSSNNIKKPIRQLYTEVEYLIKSEASRLTDTGKGAFRRMQSSLNRMSLLLDDMLSLSEISILEKPEEEIVLESIAASVVVKMKKKITEANAKVVHSELCVVPGHRVLLEILFTELIDNGIKFNSNPVPMVEVTCARTCAGEAGDETNAEYYKISFTDNGIGISDADKERIFTIFEKLNPPGSFRGSGIGLTRAAKIMDAHRGFIRVGSTPGEGSVFSCFFPAN